MADGDPVFNEAQSAELNRILNGVQANTKKLVEGLLAKGLEATTGSITKLLDEKLSAFKPATDPNEPPDPDGKGRKGKDLQIATLEKRVNDATESIRLANEKAAKAEARRRDIERTNLIDSALGKAGITDPFMRELALAHFDRRGRVQWSGEDEDSSVVWNGDDGIQVKFEDGLAAWMKTPEAGRFLPARGTGGSGSKGGPPGRNATSPTSATDKNAPPTYEDIGNAVVNLFTGNTSG